MAGEEDDDDDFLPLDANNPLVAAILGNPVVQQGMSNPRVLQALQHMMENPGLSLALNSFPYFQPLGFFHI